MPQEPTDVEPPFIQQTFDLWINPEIQRRRDAGTLPTDFFLDRTQVVFNIGLPPIVRLNDEVHAILRVSVSHPMSEGDPVFDDDITDVTAVELTDLDPNAGHITILTFRNLRYVSYNFQYNARRIAELIKATSEFMDCAKHALQSGFMRAFIENLFAATEMMAKGILAPHARPNIVGDIDDSKPDLFGRAQHPTIRQHFETWAKLGNTDRQYVQLVETIAQLRNPARYLLERFEIEATQATEMMSLAEQMFESLLAVTPARYKDLPS